MRILVTNDDGIASIGIQVLAAALASSGEHEVLVVAPSSDRSGTGTSLGGFGLEGGMHAQPHELPEAPGVEAWSLDAPPAMCVVSAMLGGFGERPDIVVSGINAGLNTGRAVLHSGTVGAVLAGQNFGISGLAVSVSESAVWRWDTAAALAVEVLPLVLDAPARSAVNLNVPALELEHVKGIRWAGLAPFGEFRAAVTGVEDVDGDGALRPRQLVMELTLTEHDFDPTTDQGVVRDGWASLTTIVGVVEAWPGDVGLAPGAPLVEAHRVPDASLEGVLRRPDVDQSAS